ncbi:PREDICTED: MDIS1-interacting receptor like [Prunus dulcis]|uniref:non-specific serine/threonine protein kinase n=1 Tax=Prunus dulcis TaxID=3755 RepID=A0A5E4EDQ5_PRUDU|nr:PREDICTED: MDIS1-interacting receptor like [Prunus dulcis]
MVAVKKLHLLHNGENNFQKEFFNEIRALTEIRHRNIMKLFGFYSHHPDTRFWCMSISKEVAWPQR